MTNGKIPGEWKLGTIVPHLKKIIQTAEKFQYYRSQDVRANFIRKSSKNYKTSIKGIPKCFEREAYYFYH